MDRLYSKFPVGRVGLALLLLRLAGGLGLVSQGWHLFTPLTPGSEPMSLVLLNLALQASALLLILGLRTALAGGAAAACTAGSALYVMQHGNLTNSQTDPWAFVLVLVCVLSASLALAGPGGYSLDARLSGWRRITLSSRNWNPPNRWGNFT